MSGSVGIDIIIVSIKISNDVGSINIIGIIQVDGMRVEALFEVVKERGWKVLWGV